VLTGPGLFQARSGHVATTRSRWGHQVDSDFVCDLRLGSVPVGGPRKWLGSAFLRACRLIPGWFVSTPGRCGRRCTHPAATMGSSPTGSPGTSPCHPFTPRTSQRAASDGLDLRISWGIGNRVECSWVRMRSNARCSLLSLPPLRSVIADAGLLLRPGIPRTGGACRCFAVPRIHHHHVRRAAAQHIRRNDQHHVSHAGSPQLAPDLVAVLAAGGRFHHPPPSA